MNILKHMEAIFLATLVLAGVSSYAQAANQAANQAAASRAADVYQAQVSVGAEQVAVVKVTAKRPA